MKNLFVILMIISMFLGLRFQAKTNIDNDIARYKKEYLSELSKNTPKNDTVIAKNGTITSFASVSLADVPKDDEWSVINKYPHKQLIAHIYQHESTFGKADVCRNKGGFNGFGYNEPNPLKNGPTCYSSFEEVVSKVNNWIEDKLNKGLTYAQMGCLYIRGQATESCNTAYKFQ